MTAGEAFQLGQAAGLALGAVGILLIVGILMLLSDMVGRMLWAGVARLVRRQHEAARREAERTEAM